MYSLDEVCNVVSCSVVCAAWMCSVHIVRSVVCMWCEWCSVCGVCIMCVFTVHNWLRSFGFTAFFLAGNDFRAGDLGPGTIVGSAAFNLFVIISICIFVIPRDEVRRVKHVSVFLVTATWSLLAYLWLYLIIDTISPGVIHVSVKQCLISCACWLVFDF